MNRLRELSKGIVAFSLAIKLGTAEFQEFSHAVYITYIDNSGTLDCYCCTNGRNSNPTRHIEYIAIHEYCTDNEHTVFHEYIAPSDGLSIAQRFWSLNCTGNDDFS